MTWPEILKLLLTVFQLVVDGITRKAPLCPECQRIVLKLARHLETHNLHPSG